MSNKEILKSMVGETNINVLSTIFQDDRLPLHVRKRAKFKIAQLWMASDLKYKRSQAAKKAATARKAKKRIGATCAN